MTEERTRRHRRHEKQQKKRRKRPQLWGYILGGFILVALVIGVGLAGLGLTWAAKAPVVTEKDLQGSIASTIFDQNGNEIFETSHNERIIIGEDHINQQTFDAVTSIEDKRFLKHNGIDLKRIAGSFLANLKAGGIAQGGSTLTQQLIKLAAFSTTKADQTYKRKVQEIWLALQLERHYSKKQIFEFYINKVYMANGVYGMGTAAQVYYSKDLDQLSLAQTAMLAGMPQAPNNYDPYTHPDKAKNRRDTVLKEMLEDGKISAAAAEEAMNEPVDADLQELKSNEEQSKKAQIVDSYIQQVDKDIKAAGFDMWTDGLKIYTHLDYDTQEYLYNLLNDDNRQYFADDLMQAAGSIIDTKTGHIVALFGGRHQEGVLGFNRATELDRSVGSSIKPFTVYGPAIEYLNLSPALGIKDEPYKYSSGDEINNWDRQYQGLISARQALAESRNIPALKLFQEVGADRVNEFTKKMHINLNDGAGAYESNSIGGELTPLALSASFATLGNMGRYNEPKAVDYFVTLEDEKIEVAGESEQAMRESTAYILTDMLKSVFTEGQARSYHNPNVIEAGKSGTTNYTPEQLRDNNLPENAVPDRWMSGYTTDRAVSLWIGYDQPFNNEHYLTTESGWAVNNVYRTLMDHLTNGSHQEDWKQPDTVHRELVELLSNPLHPSRATTPYNLAVNELINEKLYEEFQKMPAPVTPAPEYDEDDYNEEKDHEDHEEDQDDEEDKESVDSDLLESILEGIQGPDDDDEASPPSPPGPEAYLLPLRRERWFA